MFLSLFLSVSLCFSLFLSVSLYFSLFLSVSLCFSLFFSLSPCRSIVVCSKLRFFLKFRQCLFENVLEFLLISYQHTDRLMKMTRFFIFLQFNACKEENSMNFSRFLINTRFVYWKIGLFLWISVGSMKRCLVFYGFLIITRYAPSDYQFSVRSAGPSGHASLHLLSYDVPCTLHHAAILVCWGYISNVSPLICKVHL